jgi:hypothetical protein
VDRPLPRLSEDGNKLACSRPRKDNRRRTPLVDMDHIKARMKPLFRSEEFVHHIGNIFFAIELHLRCESDKAIARQTLRVAYPGL